MNYELAKELKDAGFPQNRPAFADKVNIEYLHRPTLSELIEACGLPFALECVNDATKWYASRVINDNEVKTGDTPEEAVARLWLALKTQPAAQ